MSELERGGSPPNSSELFRPGGMEGFKDRTREIAKATQNNFDRATGGTSDADLIPGHKRMAGMA